MANNNSYEKFYSVKKTKLNDVTSSFECSVNIDSTENISKILAVSVNSGLPQTEALTGEANISGNALVTIVYLTESGLVGNATYCSPYSLKVQNSEITPNAQVLARVTNVDSKVTALNGSTAQVQYEVTLKVYVVSKIEVPYLSETTDDICSTTEDVTYQSLAGTCRNNWIENIEVSVKEPIRQINVPLHAPNKYPLASSKGSPGRNARNIWAAINPIIDKAFKPIGIVSTVFKISFISNLHNPITVMIPNAIKNNKQSIFVLNVSFFISNAPNTFSLSLTYKKKV